MHTRERDAGLDTLRAFAALLVLFAHGGYFLFSAWPHYDGYALAGWLGTDLFFALSGFLVMRQLWLMPQRDTAAALRYVGWRAWRILPLFWLALGVHLLLADIAGRDTPAHPVEYVALLQNLVWTHPRFFGEAWNLPVLFLFTLAAPGLMLGASWLGPRRVAVIVGCLLVLLLGIALRAIWIVEHDPVWDEGVRKLVVTRIDACFYGALAALAWPSCTPTHRSRRIAAVVAGLTLLAAGAWFLLLARDESTWARIVLFVLSGIGTAALCVTLCDRRAVVGAAFVAPLSRWSYPLYLVNMPLLFAFDLIGWGQSTDAATGMMRFGLWLVACIVVAALLHRAVEAPWLALRRRAFNADDAIASSRR
jgi:peptidoglycan/LPS O-acetylase OafA/YrhL